MGDTAVVFEETPGGQTQWFHGTFLTSFSHLHVEDVFDTRFGPNLLWATVTEFGVSGNVTLTVAATNLQDEWNDGTPMGKTASGSNLNATAGSLRT